MFNLKYIKVMKKEIKIDIFIAKADLPGDIKKGDFVIWKDAKVPANVVLENVKVISYDPQKEPSFFIKSLMPRYRAGDTLFISSVLAKKLGLFTFKTSNLIENEIPVKVISFQQVKDYIQYTIEWKGRRASVKEDDAYQIDDYWFVNSKGVVCSLPLTKEHKQSIAYKIRCYHNNAFLSKEEAQAHLNAITIH